MFRVFVVETAARLPRLAIIAVVRIAARIFQDACEVHQVPRHDRGVALGKIVVEAGAPALQLIAVGRARPGLADPTAVGLRRDGVAEMLQRKENAHGAVLNAVLIACDYDSSHFPIIEALPLFVQHAGHAVETLDHDAANGAFLAEPDGRSNDENVGRSNDVPQFGPFVSVPAMVMSE